MPPTIPGLWGDLEWSNAVPEGAAGGPEIPSAGKNEEEIAKFTVDEHLSDIERTILYLNGGQIIQQRHAIANLPNVLRGRGRPAFDAISQPLKAALNRLDSEAQMATADAFATIARERLLSPVDLQVCILPTVTRNINREKSEEETDAWLSTLFELIPLLDKEVLKTEVLSLALSKGDVEGVVGSKTICVRILGALAPRLTWEEIERSFFKKALSLCQDVDHHIRVASCGQLAEIARVAGKDVVAKTILPELFELLNDEEVQARVASLTTLTSLLDLLPPEVRKGHVMPVLRNHMQPLELDPAMQRALARVFGQLVTVVKVDFEHDDSMLFFSCFKHLATKQDVELRKTCAAQLPAVLRAATALQASAFQSTFADTLNNLATDPDAEVRKTVAASLHEVAKVVGRECPALLTRPLCRLLRDDSPAVQVALLPCLTQCLAHWAAGGTPGGGGGGSSARASGEEARRDAAAGEVAKAMLELEQGAGSRRQWRTQQQLASAFPMFPQVFSSDQIYEHFLPMALRYLGGEGTAAMRPVAAEGLVCFMRYNKREKQRAEMLLRIIRDFCRGRSYSARITFVDIAAQLLRRFSCRFIREYVFDLVLELLYDPVPNVRLYATGLLPGLKTCIQLPGDVDLLERLNSAVSNICTDNDRDVSQNARVMNDTFKKTPMRMAGGGGTGGVLDMNASLGGYGGMGGMGGFGANGGPAGPPQVSSEAEDKRREEEEAEFTLAPEDLKELKAEILQVSSAKGNAKGGLAGGKGPVGPGQRRPGLNPVGGYDGARTSAPALGGRLGGPGGMMPGAGVGGIRRPGHGASEDGSGRGGGGVTSLGAVRVPPGGSGGSGPVSRMGMGMGGASPGAGAAKPSYGGISSSPAALSSPIKSSISAPVSRVGSATGKPSSPMTGGGAGGAGAGASPGVRLPAITSRSTPAAPSPVPGAAGKAGAGAAAGRLGGAGMGAASAASSKPLVTTAAARKTTR